MESDSRRLRAKAAMALSGSGGEECLVLIRLPMGQRGMSSTTFESLSLVASAPEPFPGASAPGWAEHAKGSGRPPPPTTSRAKPTHR